MMTDVLFIFGGFVLLFFGGDGLIRGSVTIASKLRLSTLLVSTVVIGFGTSMPELMVSGQAALKNAPDIALGNVVGSNISNTLLILGIAALITPIICKTEQIRRDVLMGVAASIFLALLSLAGVIHRFTGLAMFMVLIAYLSFNIWSEKKTTKTETKAEKKLHRQLEEEMIDKKAPLYIAVIITAFSFAALLGGARLLVDGAVSIANHFDISQAVIGLTLVALGSSLPELATACIASFRKHTDVVIGNILGSNLFNILFILGVTSLIKPITFTGRIATQDVWIMLATLALLVPVVLSGKKITRKEGGLLFLLYFIYIGWLYFSDIA